MPRGDFVSCISFRPLRLLILSEFLLNSMFFFNVAFRGLNMVEVGWQRITEPNMARRGDETDLFT